jgi:hypothetical protein
MAIDISNGRWSATAEGTNAGATASKAGIAGKTYIVDHVSCHSDSDATLQLRSGSDVLAEWYIDSSNNKDVNIIVNGYWIIEPGESAKAVVSGSTNDCQVNITGFSLP